MIYTVTFNPSLDYTLSLEKLELGRVNRAAGETLAAGGKGLNVSMVLQNLGYPSTALGFVSGFTGDEIERRLKARRCATRFIHLPAGLSRINVKVRAEEESEINGLGPPIGPEALEGLYAILDELEEGDILVLAGSIPAVLPDDIYQNILKRLQGLSLIHIYEEIVSAARSQSTRRVVISQNRGTIFDCNLQRLTNAETGYKLVVTKNFGQVKSILQKIVPDDRDYALEMAAKGKIFSVRLTGPLNFSGGYTVRYQKPVGEGQLAPHIIGYTDESGGVVGLQKALNSQLEAVSYTHLGGVRPGRL